jgi:hypothetical protein
MLSLLLRLSQHSTLQEGDEEKAEEMKILQQRLDSERRLLAEKMEREKAELGRHHVVAYTWSGVQSAPNTQDDKATV